MDLIKSYDFFQPEKCKERIHIIGCGAAGSTLADELAHYGLTKITLYDFDVVEPKNVVNQMFFTTDIGKPKVQAVAEHLKAINPDIAYELRLEEEGYTGQRLSGYVFLCMDNIDTRREIATANRSNPYIKAMFDFRIALTGAQHYGAKWNDSKMVDNFLSTMNFTHEEAKAAQTLTACHTELHVASTVRQICSAGVCNFINFVRSGGKEIKSMVLVDPFDYAVQAF